MHTSVHAQLRHTVRSVMASLSRLAIRGHYGDPRPRYRALDGLPNHESMTNRSLPSTGSPRYRFPGFSGTMKRCDFLRPSPHTRLPSRGDTTCCACAFAPSGPGRQTAGRGSVIRSPNAGPYHVETSRISQVPGKPSVPMPCSSTPAGPTTPGPYGASARPPLCPQRRLPREFTFRGSIARPGDSLSTLRRVGCPHATQDSFLAAGQALPDGIGYPQGFSERFQIVVILLSRASWRKDSVEWHCQL